MSRSKTPAGHRPAAGDRLHVTIEKLAVGGEGIARHEGFVYFVPESAPGERAEIEVVKVHANRADARVVSVLQPGRGRRAPPCKYAGECGGCNWQHLDEDVQREQKQQFVLETLRKFLPGTDIPLEPMVASPRVLRYRNRVQPLRRGGRLGYRKRRSHEFLPVDDCLIAEEPVAAFFARPAPGADDVRVELRLRDDGTAEMAEAGAHEGFSFAQVNRFQNDDLIRTVLEWSRGPAPSEIWDLYAGAGNFTFPLAKFFPGTRVTAVELDAASVQRARAAVGSQPISFSVGDVEAWVRRKTPPADALVLLDPPRAGAGEHVMKALASSPARSLIYVACHPVALARDLAAVLRSPGPVRWKLVRVRAFEMFPQTDHVETVAQLVVDSSDDTP